MHDRPILTFVDNIPNRKGPPTRAGRRDQIPAVYTCSRFVQHQLIHNHAEYCNAGLFHGTFSPFQSYLQVDSLPEYLCGDPAAYLLVHFAGYQLPEAVRETEDIGCLFFYQDCSFGDATTDNECTAYQLASLRAVPDTPGSALPRVWRNTAFCQEFLSHVFLADLVLFRFFALIPRSRTSGLFKARIMRFRKLCPAALPEP